MTEADYAEIYEQRVYAIQRVIQTILDGFEHPPRQSGFCVQTIKTHVENIRFFARYLLLNAYYMRLPDEAIEWNVCGFSEDWFHHKTLWARNRQTAPIISMGVLCETARHPGRHKNHQPCVCSQLACMHTKTLHPLTAVLTASPVIPDEEGRTTMNNAFS